jgi:hypothetical protein
MGYLDISGDNQIGSTSINIANSSNNSRLHNKEDIINVTKAVVMKSIFMQITRAKVENLFFSNYTHPELVCWNAPLLLRYYQDCLVFVHVEISV